MRHALTIFVIALTLPVLGCVKTESAPDPVIESRRRAVPQLYAAGVALAGAVDVFDDSMTLQARNRDLASAIMDAKARSVPDVITTAYETVLAEAKRMRSAVKNGETYGQSHRMADLANREYDKAAEARKETLRLVEAALFATIAAQ